MRVVAVVLAAGRGERFGTDKMLQPLAGKPLWKWSYDALRSHPAIASVGVMGSASNLSQLRDQARGAAFAEIGGEDRQSSSRRATEFAKDADAVLIHDGARPFVSGELVQRVIEGVERVGAAAPGIPATDTLRQRHDGSYELLDRDRVVAMQTPQGARRDWLLNAHSKADQTYTDEMALLEAAGFPVEVVPGDARNFKVTHPDDLERASGKLVAVETRTGLGYDVHAFSSDPSRLLVLGGVAFPGTPGLEGHSDADVLLHAAVDALLGAAALGDIGQHFPNTDPRWAGEPSTTFLESAAGLLSAAGWKVVHLDVAVIAERPKLMDRSLEMRQTMASCLGIEADRVSVKATTNEGLGSIGRGEGIAAFATATICRIG